MINGMLVQNLQPDESRVLTQEMIDNGEFEYVPDFVRELAESYGAKGMRVTEKESDIAKAFKFADKHEKAPTVLEFVIPTEINVIANGASW